MAVSSRIRLLFKKIANINKTALILYLIALAIRLSYVAMSLENTTIEASALFTPDSRIYMRLATGFSQFVLDEERILYMTGFGYSLFLSILLFITGHSLMLSLIIQNVFASLAIPFMYLIGMRLSNSRIFSVMAVSINILSPTSLSLCAHFLSETIFFAVLVTSIYLLLCLCESPSRWKWILLAIMLAYATFTRAVAQFLPLFVIISALLVPKSFFPRKKTSIVKEFSIYMLLSIALISLWAMRNYFVNDTFVVAGTGPGAAVMYLGARVAANTGDQRAINECREVFNKEYAEWNKEESQSFGKRDEWQRRKLKNLFMENPARFIKTYFMIIRDNLLAGENFSRYRDTDFFRRVFYYTQVMSHYRLPEISLGLSFVGFLILFFYRRDYAAVFLGFIYVYFALISGFTFWQGSRIFYPAQAAGVFLMTSAVYYPARSLWHIIKGIDYSRIGPIFMRTFRIIVYLIHLPNRILRLSGTTYTIAVAAIFAIIIAIFSVAVIYPAVKSPQYRAVRGAATHTFGNMVVLSQIRTEERYGHTQAVLFDLYPISDIDDNYRIYMHLYTKGGSKMYNHDFAPDKPIAQWERDIIITQRREIEAPPGEYSVKMGLFVNIHKALDDAYYFNLTIK